MTSIELKNALKAEPFRPFRVHLGGGRTVDVVDPEFVAVAPSGRTAAICGPDDAFEIVDILMIQSIEFPKQNGHGRRRKAG
jgi:hypothetical protein